MMNLSNKVAMITGAAGNLGSAVATVLKTSGANTILIDRSPDRLARTFQAGPDCMLAGGVDLTSEQSVREVVAAAFGRFGRIDALINTVGGFRGGKAVQDEDLATWDVMMTVNVRTTLLMCRAVIPKMLEKDSGAIVNVAAGAALAGPAGLAAYSASKAAVLRLTESLAAEVKAAGIRVNAVLPGTMDTPQNREAMPDADVSQFVKPDAVADVIAFLVSDASRALTGVSLPVFGRG